VSFSHWVLDLPVHRADMPLLPANAGGLPLLGFGLWRYPVVSILIELVLVLAGAWLYWRAARAVSASAGISTHRAGLVAGLIALGGVAVLALNVAGS
jgi:hypothetical protein